MRVHLLSGLGLSLVLLLPLAAFAAERDDDEAVLRGAGVATDGPGLLDFFRKRTLEDWEEKKKRWLEMGVPAALPAAGSKGKK